MVMCMLDSIVKYQQHAVSLAIAIIQNVCLNASIHLPHATLIDPYTNKTLPLVSILLGHPPDC